MIVVTAGQSLVDVCLQELGCLDALYDLADANGLTITTALQPGQVLQVPASAMSRPEVASYYASRQQRINVPDQLRTAAPPPPPADDNLQDFDKNDFPKSDFY